ncbi:hypothetical protein ACIOEZ_34195 [Streptomyces sp. NPDC087866]|uniref:hypothetical protein n=1 Tax=Streptomyces sp. NPDC087866 TaxID=3365815 RepID=UPI003826A36F
MAPSRTFSSQLRRTRATFAVTTISVLVATVYLAASALVAPEAWPPALWAVGAIALVLEIPYAYLVRAFWMDLSRQGALAPSADQLRAASQQIPDGHSRLYVDHDRGWVVHCTQQCDADQFSRFEVEDLEALDRAGIGVLVGLTATTYRVMRRPAKVLRSVWADEVVRTEGEGGLRATTGDHHVSIWGRLKVARFHLRTGAFTPDADELGELAEAVLGADRTWDVEESQS